MYNLQIYSSALLVLIFYIKTLTGLPYELPPLTAVQPKLDAGASLPASNNPVDAISVEVRSLNVSDNNPSLRSLDVQPVNSNTDVADAALGSLPSNPADQPQQEDIAARNGFGLESKQISVSVAPAGGSVNQHQIQERFNSAQLNTSLSEQGTPALRSGLENLNPGVSSVEQRPLNVNPSSVANAPHVPNDSPVEARSLDLNPAANVSSSNPFVPSFLKSFTLRQKRGEGDSSDLTVSSSLQKESPVNGSPKSAENSGLQRVLPITRDVKPAVVPQSVNVEQQKVNVAPNNANEPSRVELVKIHPAASSFVNVPFINVYPLDSLEF